MIRIGIIIPNKFNIHREVICREKDLLKRFIYFIIIPIIFFDPQTLNAQEIFISGRNQNIFSINKINLSDQSIDILLNVPNPGGLADLVLDKAGNIYGTDGRHLLKVKPNNPPLPGWNYVKYDTLVLMPINTFIASLTIDCNEVIYLGDNTNYGIYKYNLSNNTLDFIGKYEAFFCDFDFYNGDLLAHAYENRNFLGKSYLMRIHLNDLNIKDTIFEVSNLPFIDGVLALASNNDECGSNGLYAPRHNEYIKYEVENDTYNFVSFPNLSAGGAASATSWLGSYAPLELDSIKIFSDFSNCLNPYSIKLAKRKGCCIRPGIEFSLDGINFQSDSTFSNLVPGKYVIHLKDSLGCYRLSDTIVLEEKQSVNLKPNKTTCGQNNGSLIINKPHLPINYTISIDGGIFTNLDSIPNLVAGPHEVIIEYEEGCRDTSIVNIDALPLPDFSTIQNVTDDYCGKNTGSIHLVTSDPLNVIYYSYDGINYIKDSIRINDLIDGHYQIFLKHESGCLDTVDYEIKSFPAPVFDDIIIKAASCGIEDGVIKIVSSDSNDQIMLNGITSPTNIFSLLGQANYLLEIKNSYGCITDSTVFLPGKNLPVINDLIIKNARCNENNGSIEIFSADPSDKYSLDAISFQNSHEFFGLAAGNYNFYIQNEEGCIKGGGTTIIQTGLPIIDSLVTTDESCSEHNGAVRIHTSGNPVMIYTLNDEFNSTLSNFVNLKSGIYTVSIIDTFGCQQFAYFNLQNIGDIKELNSISIQKGNCSNPIATLVLPQNVEDTYSLPGIPVTIDGKYLLEPGTYTLHIENELCSRDTSIVIPQGICEPFIPNVFSPNDDSINDVFRAEGSGFEVIDFRVFNRWGGVVFSEINSNKGWDGSYKGKLVELGVYTYFMEIRFGDVRKVLKGNVTLVR